MFKVVKSKGVILCPYGRLSTFTFCVLQSESPWTTYKLSGTLSWLCVSKYSKQNDVQIQ